MSTRLCFARNGAMDVPAVEELAPPAADADAGGIAMKSNASCTLVHVGWMRTGPASPPRTVRSLNSLQDLTVEGLKDITVHRFI